MRMYMRVNVCVYSACVYVCICIYVCLCICMHIHYIRASVGVHMHWRRRILFICTVQSLYYMPVYHRCFLTLACVWGGIGSGVCFSLFMVTACYWRGRLCFCGGRDRSFVLYIFLFLRVLGWWGVFPRKMANVLKMFATNPIR